MKPYIYGERNGIYIVDLQKTAKMFDKAYEFIRDTAAQGGTVLFVGTKKQAMMSMSQEAKRCGQFSVTNRWLGGLLTNFSTIRKSITKLNRMEDQRNKGVGLVKKEIQRMGKLIERLDKNLSGYQDMNRLPDAVFIVDPKRNTLLSPKRAA